MNELHSWKFLEQINDFKEVGVKHSTKTQRVTTNCFTNQSGVAKHSIIKYNF